MEFENSFSREIQKEQKIYHETGKKAEEVLATKQTLETMIIWK